MHRGLVRFSAFILCNHVTDSLPLEALQAKLVLLEITQLTGIDSWILATRPNCRSWRCRCMQVTRLNSASENSIIGEEVVPI